MTVAVDVVYFCGQVNRNTSVGIRTDDPRVRGSILSRISTVFLIHSIQADSGPPQGKVAGA
jgi:hypothetical protein